MYTKYNMAPSYSIQVHNYSQLILIFGRQNEYLLILKANLDVLPEISKL